jgi:glycosyltransferase involved in cell wall biosynthesis
VRIALLGMRGVPASYGGFETAAEQIGQRLVQRGHQVTVYCRTPHIQYAGDMYLGMRLVKLPTIRTKHLDTLAHTFLSSVHACFQRYDVAIMFIAGNSLVSWIPRLVGTPVALNVDGLDWKRPKWNRLAQSYIRLAERMSRWFPTCVITDSRIVQDFYLHEYNTSTVFIPYGSDLLPRAPGETLSRLGLEPHRYILFVGRLVPENNAHQVVDAFTGLRDKNGLKLVIVGDAPYVSGYVGQVRKRAAACSDVLLTGYIFGDAYRELASNAYLTVVATEVGGTHPVLLEYMSLGKCVVVNDIPANMEAIADTAVPYSGRDGARALRSVLEHLIARPDLVTSYGRRASERAASVYRWDAITDEYERLCERLTGLHSVDSVNDWAPASSAD